MVGLSRSIALPVKVPRVATNQMVGKQVAFGVDIGLDICTELGVILDNNDASSWLETVHAFQSMIPFANILLIFSLKFKTRAESSEVPGAYNGFIISLTSSHDRQNKFDL